MPSKIHFTERDEHHCNPCSHLQFENACYGHRSVTGTFVCHHPEANEFEPLSTDPKIAAKQGELRAKIVEYGRVISKQNDRQPSWCPLRRNSDVMAPYG